MKCISQDVRDVGRGHAEILLEQISNCLEMAGIGYTDLNRISVSSGPGSFTGIRVGLAAARGLGLGLDIPVVGITTLQACEMTARQTGFTGTLLSVLDAGRNQLYCKHSGLQNCWIASAEEVASELIGEIDGICGSGAPIISPLLADNPVTVHELRAMPISVYAELGQSADACNPLPEPVYLRKADAKPQHGSLTRISATGDRDG